MQLYSQFSAEKINPPSWRIYCTKKSPAHRAFRQIERLCAWRVILADAIGLLGGRRNRWLLADDNEAEAGHEIRSRLFTTGVGPTVAGSVRVEASVGELWRKAESERRYEGLAHGEAAAVEAIVSAARGLVESPMSHRRLIISMNYFHAFFDENNFLHGSTSTKRLTNHFEFVHMLLAL